MLTEKENYKVKQLRILIVDDNVDAAIMTGSLLDHLGYNVSVQYSPGAALKSADDNVFDLFVLDIGLPGMDDYELASLLREKPNAGQAVFAALTGYGSEYYVSKSAAEGFKYHFVKPVPIHKLLNACESIIADLAHGNAAKR